jgi:FixJ family two-component response regulator
MTDTVVPLIGDDPGLCRGVSRLLRSHGRQVQTYGSAKDFLGHPLPSGPACIVLTGAREAFARRDALGLTKEIGGEFGTMEKTIKVQRGCVMKKLGPQSVADVVWFVERFRTAGYLPAHPKLSGN